MTAVLAGMKVRREVEGQVLACPEKLSGRLVPGRPRQHLDLAS